jgi:hypothetical protein
MAVFQISITDDHSVASGCLGRSADRGPLAPVPDMPADHDALIPETGLHGFGQRGRIVVDGHQHRQLHEGAPTGRSRNRNATNLDRAATVTSLSTVTTWTAGHASAGPAAA